METRPKIFAVAMATSRENAMHVRRMFLMVYPRGNFRSGRRAGRNYQHKSSDVGVNNNHSTGPAALGRFPNF